MIAVATVVASAGPAFGQQMNCGQAVAQLQTYAVQVNQYANQVYYSIPMQCGYNQYCAQNIYAQLYAWYQQQSQMVNSWYIQINQQCNQTQAPPLRARGGQDRPPEIDRKVEDLQVDDEDKTVRIRIPSTPRGFQ